MRWLSGWRRAFARRIGPVAQARRLRAAGRPEAATRLLRLTIAVRPSHRSARIARADLATEAGDWPLAARSWSEVLAHGEPIGWTLPRVLMSKALRALGRLREAEEVMQRCLALHPEDGAALYEYAVVGREARRTGESAIAARVAGEIGARLGSRQDAARLLGGRGGALEVEDVATTLVEGGEQHIFAAEHRDARPGGTAGIFEKCLEGDSGELIFWRAWLAGRIALDGRVVAAPVLAIHEHPIFPSLFFPLLGTPPIDRETFLARIDDIVRLAAAINGAGRERPGAAPQPPAPPDLLDPPPAPGDLAAFGFFPRDEAEGLRRRYAAVADAWPAIARARAALPRVLGHNDIHPGNLVDGARGLALLDWGEAGIAPIGTELRSIMLFSDRMQFDGASRARIVEAYRAGLAAEGLAAGRDEIELGLWSSYFRHRADIPDDHEFNLDTFRLAVAEGERLAAACRG